MSLWKVIPAAQLNLDEYIVTAFGRFNEAVDFVGEFLSSGEKVSAMIVMDTSNVNKLRTAIIKSSGVTLSYREVKDKDGNTIRNKRNNAPRKAPIMSNAVLDKACSKLNVEIKSIGKVKRVKNDKGKSRDKFVAEYLQLIRK